tara:strand:- start:908 stop:1360 length:453 start_codon:yes stop_codon:yes gene_type:complete
MSILSVNTVKSLTSAAPVFQNSTGTEKGQLVKAWVNFNGFNVTSSSSMTGVISSFNIAGVTDHATGDYTITFPNGTFTNANYCFAGALNNKIDNGNEMAGDTRGPVGIFQSFSAAPTTTTIRIETRYGADHDNAGGNYDFNNVYCIFFGG